MDIWYHPMRNLPPTLQYRVLVDSLHRDTRVNKEHRPSRSPHQEEFVHQKFLSQFSLYLFFTLKKNKKLLPIQTRNKDGVSDKDKKEVDRIRLRRNSRLGTQSRVPLLIVQEPKKRVSVLSWTGPPRPRLRPASGSPRVESVRVSFPDWKISGKGWKGNRLNLSIKWQSTVPEPELFTYIPTSLGL